MRYVKESGHHDDGKGSFTGGHTTVHDGQTIAWRDDRDPKTLPVDAQPISVETTTTAALTEVIIDRLMLMQLGKERSKRVACAITHLEEALQWLESWPLSATSKNLDDLASLEGGPVPKKDL